MLFADPLSRVCAPTEGWYDPSLPRTLAALFEHLPDEVRDNVNMRVYAGKDTYAAGRLVQKWRKPSNPISQGKLLTKELSPTAFHIGIDDVNKSVNEVVKMIKGDKNFAVLMPISVTSEIARLENVDGERCHDLELAKKVSVMSKITLASSLEVWHIKTFQSLLQQRHGRARLDRSSRSLPFWSEKLHWMFQFTNRVIIIQ